MKSKAFNKKLSLHKATVASLEAAALKGVKGGIVTYPRGVCIATVNDTICFTDCGPQVCLAN